MRPAEPTRSVETRRTGVRLGMGVLAVAVLAACTGDNLFTGLALSNQLTGPEVTITSPGGNVSVAPGVAVSVTAEVTSSEGVSEMVFSGIFEDGSPAFTAQTVALPNPQDTTLTKSLAQPGTSTGSAKIIVEATDILGSTGADTVTITIGP